MLQDIPGVDDDPGEEQDYDDLEDDFFAPAVIDPQEQRIYEADYLKDDSYIKLLKANSVIRGKVVADKRGLKINIYDLKVLNFLLKTLQECVKKDTQPVKFTTLVIPLELFKRVVDDAKNWRTNFIKSVEKLEYIAFELNNYRDWEKNEFIIWQKTRLVITPNFKTKGEERKKATCEISFAKELATACWQKTDYTHLDFKTLNSFTSKYAIRFYEALVAKIQYYTNSNNYKTEYDFKQEELEGIFDVKLSSIPIGFKNFLDNKIHFDDVVIPDLQGKLQFDYEIHGKDKIITFKFQKDYLEQFRTRKADTVDLAIEKFRNLIDAKKTYDDGHTRVYEIDTDKPENAMMDFLLNISQYYYGVSLLKRPEEINRFGEVAMSREGDLYYINTRKRISYGRAKKFLIYLYKNYYEQITREIRALKEKGEATAKAKQERSLFDDI